MHLKTTMMLSVADSDDYDNSIEDDDYETSDNDDDPAIVLTNLNFHKVDLDSRTALDFRR